MPANTPKGYPYPLGTDRLADGDDAIHNLATAVDTLLGTSAAGVVNPPVPSALNTPVNVAVTFPAGRFTAPPQVLCTAQTPAGWSVAVSAASITATGCLIHYSKTSGGLVSVPVMWLAVLPS